MNRPFLLSARGVTAAAFAFGLGFALAPNSASAALLGTGEINSVGAVDDLLPSSGGTGTDASDATGIDFDNDSLFVINAGGSLASFTSSTGTIQDIPVGTLPMSGGLAYSVASFYTLTAGADTLVFDLDSILSVTRDPTGNTELGIAATGTVRATIGGIVYDPTPAIYNITVQGDGTTSFSSSTEVTGGVVDVPEPTTLALFGMGLLGLGAVARRRLG